MSDLMFAVGVFGACFAIGITVGIIFGLPMIWYHIGHISRKTDKTNAILDEIADVLEDIRDIEYKKNNG